MAIPHLGAEVADQGLHRRQRQAELGGDVGLEPVFDEEGAKHFVTTLERRGGLEEEAAAEIVVHGRFSGIRVTFSPVYSVEASTSSG